MFGYWDDEPKKKYVIFLEIEGVLQSLDAKTTAKNDTWYDRKAAWNLQETIDHVKNSRIDVCLVVVGKWTDKKSIEQVKELFAECDLDSFIADDMEQFLGLEKKKAIDLYLNRHEDISKYVVLDNKVCAELEVCFPLHCVFTYSVLKEEDCVRLDRKLSYGYGWEKEYMFSKKHEIDDGFEKVIFLDIDGVLNKDRTSGRKDEEKIEIEYVKNLDEIVKKTGAEIILSSSWRYGMSEMTGENLTEHEKRLLKLLAERNMYIAGATPTIMNGPDGRPLEIKQWLSKRQSVGSFVVLDDEDFWRWTWLLPYVVTTSYRVEDNEGFIRRYAGLEKRFVDEAVRILNQFDKDKTRL